MSNKEIIEKYIRVRRFYPDINDFLKKNDIADEDGTIKAAIETRIAEMERAKEEISLLVRQNVYFHLQNGDSSIYFHPCTDGIHEYQISFFNGDIAISDIRRDTIEEIEQELVKYYHYNIKEVYKI